MTLTRLQTRALRRVAEGPATNLDVGRAIGAHLRPLIMSLPADERPEAIGRGGQRVALALVRRETVAVFTKKGVPVYAITGAGRKALAERDGAAQ